MRGQDEAMRRILEEHNRRLRDPSYRAMLEHIDRMNRNPAYRAAAEFEDKLRNDPLRKAAIEDYEKMQRDPVRKVLIDFQEELRHDPTRRALLDSISKPDNNMAYDRLRDYEINQRHYRELSDLARAADDSSIRVVLGGLERDLSERNAELWVNTSSAKEDSTAIEDFAPRLDEREDVKTEAGVTDYKKTVSAAKVILQIKTDLETAKQEAESGLVVMYIVLGGHRYRVSNLVAEEKTNRIKVFLDEPTKSMIVFYEPSELKILFSSSKLENVGSAHEPGLFLRRKVSRNKTVRRKDRKRKRESMKQLSVLNVVVASPSDVQVERDAVALVIEEINSTIGRSNGIRLELLRWETDAYPGFHLDGPQGLIDEILNIEDCDIFIGIFWNRFGTPTKRGQSGTEHEFRKAYDAWRENGSPRIMFYFNQAPYTPQSSQQAEQKMQVLQFKEEFPEEGMWHAYTGEREFESEIRLHLIRFVLDYIEKDDDAPAVIVDEEIELTADSDEAFDLTFVEGCVIRFDIEATEPIEIILFDEEDYDAWSETNEVGSYYEHYPDRTETSFNFTVPENGDYTLVLVNHGEVDTSITVFIRVTE